MPAPIDIRPVGSNEVLILWEDQTRNLFSCRDLRYHCPCAECVDERTGKRVIRLEQIPENLSIREISPVGRYAIRFTWSDGHSTGIYSFGHLQALGRVELPPQTKG